MKLKYNEIKYSYKFNMGNYESEDISISAAIEDGCPVDSLLHLKAMVQKAHGEPAKVMIAESTGIVQAASNVTPIKASKAPVKAAEAPVEQKVEKAEEKVAEKPPEPKNEPVKQEEPVKAEVKEAPKPKAKSQSVYDRTNDLHKKLAGEILDHAAPGWRRNIEKARVASEKVHGEPFLNSDGSICPQFKEKLIQLVKG